MFEYQQKCSTQ